MTDAPALNHPLPEFALTIELPILWGDQDAFGHVNNTLSFRWFESARIAYLERSGMAALMQAGDVGPILASVSCNFRRQLRYPDTVCIGARISRLGRTSFTMEHAVYSVSQQTIASDGSSTVVVFDYKTNRPRRIPDDLRAAADRFEPTGVSGSKGDEA
ncbi:MAG: thioesterase family protein [Acidobacteria bacterium]|nr:thioesterase family protein [Acidobacteriota bacterium]